MTKRLDHGGAGFGFFGGGSRHLFAYFAAQE
jgi:hypothetical protein